MTSEAAFKRKHMTPAVRNLCIKADRSRAAESRLLKEISRQKILIEHIPEDIKPPSIYIEEAKKRYLSLQESKSTRSIVSKDSRLNISTTRSQVSPFKKVATFEKSIKKNEFIPDWLLSRPDFKEACKLMEIEEQERIPYILDIHPYSRSDEDRKLMLNYLKSIKFFEGLPISIIQETGNKLIKQTYEAEEFIINKGENADSLIIIYKGSASVYLDTVKLATKKEGDVVGEIALDTRMPRSADVIADTSTIVFKLLKEDYDAAILNLKRKEKYQNVELLRGIGFFENWSHLKLLRISALMNYKVFNKGAVIYERNNPSSAMFIVKEGMVEVFVYVPMEQSNKWPVSNKEWRVHQVNREYLVRIAQLSPGQYFGESELKENSKRTMKAIAKTEVCCLMLNKDHFLDYFNDSDLASLALMSYVKVPSIQSLQEKVMSQITSRINSENALLDALKVNFINLQGRESNLDPQRKRLNPWLKNFKNRRSDSTSSVKQKVVHTSSRDISIGKIKIKK